MILLNVQLAREQALGWVWCELAEWDERGEKRFTRQIFFFFLRSRIFFRPQWQPVHRLTDSLKQQANVCENQDLRKHSSGAAKWIFFIQQKKKGLALIFINKFVTTTELFPCHCHCLLKNRALCCLYRNQLW